MASGPDLFVVCKKCGSEVSPYITECPYCGTRLRKRAPKLERGGVAAPPKAARRRRPSLGRLKPGEIPGIRGDRRPYATMAIVLASVIATLGWKAGLWEVTSLWLTDLNTDDYLRTVTTLFVYGQTGYEIVALGATFLFGWLLERRHGFWAPRDVLGRRRGREDESDLLGALAIAAVLILLPLASEEASALAGLGGGLIGGVLRLVLARLPER